MLPDIPGTPVPGEQPLRWLIPSLTDWVLIQRHILFVFSLVAVAGLLASTAVAVCAGFLIPPEWALILWTLGVAVSVFVGLIIGVLRRPGRVSWWVTTRRLVLRVGKEVHEFPISSITAIDVDGGTEMTVTANQESHDFAPVNALSELWGAILFARAWKAPDFELGDEAQHDENVLRWAELREGFTVTRGILVLLPDFVAWIPERVVRSAGKIFGDIGARMAGEGFERVNPIPPLAQMAWLMQRTTDPTLLRRESERIADACGGWHSAPAGIATRREDKRKAVSLHIDRGDMTYSCHAMPPEFTDALLEGWGS